MKFISKQPIIVYHDNGVSLGEIYRAQSGGIYFRPKRNGGVMDWEDMIKIGKYMKRLKK